MSTEIILCYWMLKKTVHKTKISIFISQIYVMPYFILNKEMKAHLFPYDLPSEFWHLKLFFNKAKKIALNTLPTIFIIFESFNFLSSFHPLFKMSHFTLLRFSSFPHVNNSNRHTMRQTLCPTLCKKHVRKCEDQAEKNYRPGGEVGLSARVLW